MRKLFGIFAPLALAIAGVASAQAAAITRTYDINASGFSGTGTPTVDPWHAIVTVTFDPFVDSGPTPVGSFTSADLNDGASYGPYSFTYDASSQTLRIGDNCPGPIFCTLSNTDAILTLLLPTPDSPTFSSAIYRTASFVDFSTATGTVTASGAALITRTYNVNASGFSSSDASAPQPPVDPWNLTVTVTFDPAVNSVPTPVDSLVSGDLTSGGYGPYSYIYDAPSQTLRIGDNCPGPTFCTLSGTDAILTLQLPTPDAPTFDGAVYRTVVNSQLFDYQTRTGTASAESTVQVPEPASLALFGLALAGVGFLRRRAA